MWSRVRLTKIQATTRTDYLWHEIWIGVSKAAKKSRKATMGFRRVLRYNFFKKKKKNRKETGNTFGSDNALCKEFFSHTTKFY